MKYERRGARFVIVDIFRHTQRIRNLNIWVESE